MGIPGGTNGGRTNAPIEQWNGDDWQVMQLPPDRFSDELYSVSGTSADDVWLMGASVAWHYDGSSFTRVPGPVSHAVCAISSTDAWGVASVDGTAELNHSDGTE